VLAQNFHSFIEELGQTKQDKFDYFYERLGRVQALLQEEVGKRERRE
jgi:hypothetical protein